jgi:hypothetical protein
MSRSAQPSLIQINQQMQELVLPLSDIIQLDQQLKTRKIIMDGLVDAEKEKDSPRSKDEIFEDLLAVFPEDS